MAKPLGSVWHYTTAQGLRDIVESKTLWATSHRFLNDAEEPVYAEKVLRQEAKEVARTLPSEAVRDRFRELMGHSRRRGLEAFLLCAAREPDLLTVWRNYGDVVPYALELDASVPLLPVRQRRGKKHPFPPVDWDDPIDHTLDGEPIYESPDAIHIESLAWTSVRYDSKLARRRVANIAQHAKRTGDPISDLLGGWANLGGIDLLQLKHPAFKDEREARYIFEVAPRWKFVKHRASRFGLTPYIQVSPAEKENQTSANQLFVKKPASRLPIIGVHIGPSRQGSESLDALKEFLEFHGYPDLPLMQSKTPLR